MVKLTPRGKIRTSFELDLDLWRELKRLAIDESGGGGLRSVVEKALQEYVERTKKKGGKHGR